MHRGWSILVLWLALCSSCRGHPNTAAAQHEGCGQHHPLVTRQQALLRRRLQQLRNTVLQPGVYAFSDESTSGGPGGSASSSILSGAAAAAAATNSDMPHDRAEIQSKAATGGSSSSSSRAQQAGKAAAAGTAAAVAASLGGSKSTHPSGTRPLLPSKLRIRTVFQLQGLSAGDSRRVKEQLVPAAIQVLQKYIKVLHPKGGVQRVGAAFGDGQQGCLTSNVDAHLAAGNASMADTDLVLYVSTDTSTCMPGMIAIATACDVDADTRRPILGSLNVCGGALEGLADLAPGSEAEAAAVGRVVEVLVHEVVHVLGFGATHFDDWRGPDGKRYGKDNVVKKVGGRPYLATPKATAVARNFFGCDTLPGAPLENEGPSFSAISHFEYRLLQRELMSPARPVDRSRSRLSAFTLAALEDTGWYVADYSQVGVLDWGRNAGCDFVTSSCWDYMGKAPDQPYFCGKGTLNQTRCTAQAAGWGVCRSSAFSDGCLLVGKYSTNGVAVVSDVQQPSSEDGRQAACYSPPQLQQMTAAGGGENGAASLLPLLGGSYSARQSDVCYNLVQPQQQPHDDVVWVRGRGQLPEDVGKGISAPPVQASDGRQQRQQQQQQQQQQQRRPTDSARLSSAQEAAAACVKVPASAAASGTSSTSGGSSNNKRHLLSMALPGAVLPSTTSQRHLTEVGAAAGPLAVAGGTSLAALDSIQRQAASQRSAIAASVAAASAACTSSSVLCFRSSCDSAGRLWVTATPPGADPVTFACPSRAVIDLSKQLPNCYLLGFLQCPINALVCEGMGCAGCSASGGYCSQGRCYCHMERYGKGCADTLVPKLT